MEMSTYEHSTTIFVVSVPLQLPPQICFAGVFLDVFQTFGIDTTGLQFGRVGLNLHIACNMSFVICRCGSRGVSPLSRNQSGFKTKRSIYSNRTVKKQF